MVADFGQALGALLRRYHAGAREAVSHLPGGPRGYQVMSISSAGACSTQAAIASSLGIDRTVMTYLVDDLESAGLVERRPDPADRRARRVVVTGKGAEVFGAAAAAIGEVERAVLASLSDEDAALFRRLLESVTADAEVDHGACDVPSEC